ncbi:hypothetical protein M0R45_002138 [Rubus argutus]|uniref:Uncharacterized protein n=1 Tax=Rubus argutus TaxID=59490 RepID=A0AAW1VJF1_RUBAR
MLLPASLFPRDPCPSQGKKKKKTEIRREVEEIEDRKKMRRKRQRRHVQPVPVHIRRCKQKKGSAQISVTGPYAMNSTAVSNQAAAALLQEKKLKK